MTKTVTTSTFDENVSITLDAPVARPVVTKRDTLGNVLETAKSEKTTISVNVRVCIGPESTGNGRYSNCQDV